MRYLKLSLVLLAVAGALVPVPATTIERLYSQGVYAWLQPVVTRSSSLVPVALLDLAAGVLLVIILTVLVRRWRALGFVRAMGRSVVSALVLAAVVYLWFLLFWGLNYRRVPLEQKLAYDQSRVTRQRAARFAGEAVVKANALAIAPRGAFGDEVALGDALLDVQRRLGAHGAMRVARPKSSLFGWYLRQAAIDGLTNPFFLEVILHPDLLPFERPFVLAHEWAHLAGYANESEANFIAWLACVRSTPAAQYSGWLAAYRHMAGQLPRDERLALHAQLSPPVAADLVSASRRVLRSSPTVRTAARGAYHTYLRANRVEEGIASYNAVVRLMLGAAFDEEWTPDVRP